MGFGEEITQMESIDINSTHFIWRYEIYSFLKKTRQFVKKKANLVIVRLALIYAILSEALDGHLFLII